MNDSTGAVQKWKIFRRPQVCMLAALSLLLMTVALFELAPRYDIAGPRLLNNGDFEGGLKGWTAQGVKGAVTADNGVAVLNNHDPSRSVNILQTLAAVPGQEHLLTAEAATKGVRQGAKSWHAARVFLVGRTAEGKSLYSTRHVLVKLTGDNPWRRYSYAFTVTNNVKEVAIGAQLILATGVLKLRNMRLVPVRERAAFRATADALLVIWAVVFAWIGVSFLRGAEISFVRGSTAVVTLVIIAGVMIPGPVKNEVLTMMWSAYGELQSALAEGFPGFEKLEWGEPEFLGVDTGQAGHFTMFFVLSLLVRFVRTTDQRGFQFLSLLLFAAITEALQYFVPSRQPEVGDLLFDTGGILVAFILLRLFSARSHGKKIERMPQ